MTVFRSAVVRYLQTNGPSTGAELPRADESPTLSTAERREGARSFNPSISSSSAGGSKIGQTVAVYYLSKEHDAEAVMREWARANPRVLEGAGPRAFIEGVNNVGPPFSDVSKGVARDLYGEAKWQDAFGETGGGTSPGVEAQETRKRLLDMDPSEVFEDDDDN